MTDQAAIPAKFNPAEHLTDLKGKDYLEVKWRLVWLRGEFPDAVIKTEHVLLGNERAIFKAEITLPNGGGSTGYGSETMKDFRDFLEKAETKAIGRALAALGYGTAFAPELEEGERIVDAPVGRSKPKFQGTPTQQAHIAQPQAHEPGVSVDQLRFIRGLWKDLGYVATGADGKVHHDAAALDQWLTSFWNVPPMQLTKSQASQVLDMLKQTPKAEGGEEIYENIDPNSGEASTATLTS